jgi:threonine dehydrogenase-like Zn-dependent dehydrogenase
MTGKYSEHGIKDLDGFMTEFVVEDRAHLHPVPRELRDFAVLVEPLTIAEKALIEIRQIQQRLPWGGAKHRAVVLGAGPVGLLGAMVLVNEGFETVVYSRGAKPNAKADVAEAVGARYISSEQVSIEQMAEEVGNIDLIYEAAGAPQFAFEVLKHLGSNGIYVFTGVPRGEQPVVFDTERIMHNMVLKNQVVLGVVNAGPQAFDNAVRDVGVFAARWPQAVRAMITGRYPMEAFRDPVTGRAGGIKNVISICEVRP